MGFLAPCHLAALMRMRRAARKPGWRRLDVDRSPERAKALAAAPGPNRENDQDRVSPEAQRHRISDRHQVEFDRFERMAKRGGQLQSANPQRPKAVGAQGDEGEDGEDQQVSPERRTRRRDSA